MEVFVDVDGAFHGMAEGAARVERAERGPAGEGAIDFCDEDWVGWAMGGEPSQPFVDGLRLFLVGGGRVLYRVVVDSADGGGVGRDGWTDEGGGHATG